MIKRSLVPLLPEGGRTYYNRIGDRSYRLTIRPCAQTCMPGHCENMMVTHPEWSIYKMTQALMGREKGQQIRELKPIVCLHGFSESSSTWNDIYLPGYLVIGIDILGHGGSSSPDDLEAYTFESILKDVHSIITCRVQGSYALMGYSQGARLALLYALQYGSEISKLVLESGSVGIEDSHQRYDRQQRDYALAQAIEEKGIEWFEERWSQLPIFETQKGLNPRAQKAIKNRRLANDPRGLAMALRALGQGSMPYVGNQIQKLTMPWLYLAGDLDDKYKTIGQTYFSHNLAILEGAGHNSHLEQPEIFSQLVYDFLERD